MAFKMMPVASVTRKVNITVPGDNGISKREDIKVSYKKLSVSQVKEMLSQAEAGAITDDELLANNVLNIEGVVNESGESVPYSIDVLTELLEMEYVRAPLVKSFMELQLGQEALKAKNS